MAGSLDIPADLFNLSQSDYMLVFSHYNLLLAKCKEVGKGQVGLATAVANLGTVSRSYLLSIHRLIQIMTNPPPDTRISDMQIFIFFGVLPHLAALIGTSLISGIFLNWLLQFRRKESVEK